MFLEEIILARRSHMSKKVFIVSSSPRVNGNSDALAEEFARGARESRHAVTKVSVRDLIIKN